MHTYKSYRYAWTKHYGPIPKDEKGRSFEVHHIDGDHSNNNIDNLKLVSIEEHYQIHYDQGDFGACWAMAKRMDLTSEMLSKVSKEINKKMIERGDHPFLGDNNPSRKKSKDGTHHFFGGEVQRKLAIERSKNGTHNFLDGEVQKRYWQTIRNNGGEHPTQIKSACPHCGIMVNKTNMKRWHGDKCKANHDTRRS